MVTRSTASKELLAKYEDLRERRAQFFCTSQEAYEVGESWRQYDALRLRLISDKKITYRPAVEEVAIACYKFTHALMALLNQRQTADPGNISNHYVLMYLELASTLDAIARACWDLWKADYFVLLKRFFLALPKGLAFDAAGNARRRRAVSLAVLDAGKEDWTILESAETGEKISLKEFARRFPARESAPLESEDAQWEHGFEHGRYADSDYGAVFAAILAENWTSSRYGLGSSELQPSGDFYERAERERTLHRLEVERRIALSVLDLRMNLAPREIVEAALKDRNRAFALSASRLENLRNINAPLVVLDNEQGLMKKIKYQLWVLKRNRSWLIEFLSK